MPHYLVVQIKKETNYMKKEKIKALCNHQRQFLYWISDLNAQVKHTKCDRNR